MRAPLYINCGSLVINHYSCSKYVRWHTTMYDARLASLKAFFILGLEKKYLYMATCTSDGTYNYLTNFREK